MSKVHEARRKFAAAVEKAGGGTAAAFQLGVSAAMVSYICDGKRDVGLETAFRIQEVYGIPMEEWVENTEPETVKRFAR